MRLPGAERRRVDWGAVLAAAVLVGAAARSSASHGAGSGSRPVTARGAPATVQQLLTRLARTGAATRSLRATFEQTKRLALFTTDIKTRGTCFYLRPDKLRWQTDAPDASALIVRGDTLLIGGPGQTPRRVALSQSPVLAGLMGDLYIWLGLGPVTGLAQRYVMRTGASDELILTPRQPALRGRVRQVTVTVGGDGVVRGLRILEQGGDRTSIKITRVERNVALSPSLFEVPGNPK